MTQRFGRNKRRAAREAVARAEAAAVAALATARQQVDAANMRANRMKDQLDEICDRLIDALGPQTAFLPIDRAPTMGFEDVRQWGIDTTRLRPSPSLDAKMPFEPIRTRVVDMVRLIAEVERDPRRHEVLVRLRDTNRTKEPQVLYISEPEFLRRGPGRDGLRHLMRFVEGRFADLYRL